MVLLWKENFLGKQIVPSGGAYQMVSPFSVPNSLNNTGGIGLFALVPDSEYGTSLQCFVPNSPVETERCEFDLDIGSPTEYYMELLYRLPSDYTLTQNSPGYGGWHEIFDAIDEWASDNVYGLKIKLWMLEGGKMQLRCDHGIPQNNVWAAPAINYMPPLGGWFKLMVHLVRHPSNGRVTVWINNDLLFDVQNVPTMERSHYLVLTTKVYGGYMADKVIYCAGISLYDKPPSSPPPPPVNYVLDVLMAEGGTTNLTGRNTYPSGTQVTITATAAAGYVFAGWLVNNQAASINPLPLTITQDMTVMPLFNLAPTPPPSQAGAAIPFLLLLGGISVFGLLYISTHGKKRTRKRRRK